MSFIKQHWVSICLLGMAVFFSFKGAEVESTVCAVGSLIHLKLEEMSG